MYAGDWASDLIITTEFSDTMFRYALLAENPVRTLWTVWPKFPHCVCPPLRTSRWITRFRKIVFIFFIVFDRSPVILRGKGVVKA